MEAGTRTSRARFSGWLGAGVPPLSTPYLAAAVGIGVAVAGATLVEFGLSSRGLVAVVFATGLVAIGFIDLEHRVIPNRVVIPLIVAVLVLQLALFPDRALEWVAAGCGAAVVLAIPAFVRPGSIGMGDIKLAFLIGLGLGEAVVTALFLGSLAAVPVALWIIAKRGFDARKDTIPLGPFLAGGAILAVFVGGSF